MEYPCQHLQYSALQFTPETVSRDLSKLTEKGLIKSSGSKGAGSFYTLV